ncbi:hypothetical protein F3Y22_tig00111635pilonHSYRG00037 [Hibiscus syriacus]|uniref:CR-type domain-containing protein n=1 Tax=Hibiscus syriacus TaxID=106335 RepID=A0A6A2XKG9_HIBSY|nr:hypothetical protein F3Y22_tig00111635pilonHSYRG00037 [Hibiscus syriacus]
MAEMMRNDQTSTDIQTGLLLSFSEAAKGCTKDLCFDAFVPCDSYDECGYPPNAKVKVCPICRGKGTVTIPPFTSTCNTCNGLGRIIKNTVYHAKDPGLLKVLRKLKLQYLQVWILEIQYVYQKLVILSDREINLVTDDPVFARDGADVYAILGVEVEVPTLSGKVQVKDCQSMVFYYIMEISMSASALICQRMFRITLYQIILYVVTYQVIMLGTRTTYVSERFSLALNLKYGYCVLFLQIGDFGLSKNAYVKLVILKMFTALGIYSESFEKPFLECTSEFYAAEK